MNDWIDDDWVSDPDEDDAPRMKAHAGILSVPGSAKSEEEFQALAAGYRADRPVLFIEHDEAANEIYIGNLSELYAAGFTGQTIAQAEAWLAPHHAASPTAKLKGTHYGPPRK